MKQAASTAFLAKDLVCGMIVDTRGAIFKASYAGKVYYFCSSECLKLFKRRAKLYSMDFLETLPATRSMDDNQFAERRTSRWAKLRRRKMPD